MQFDGRVIVVPLAGVLGVFQSNIAECDDLIVAAHRTDGTGEYLFTRRQRELITVGAFLEMFKAWERFLEQAICNFLVGHPAISLRHPVRRALPIDVDAAGQMLIGTMRYFDFANHDNVVKMVKIYFANGHPFEPHLSAASPQLADLRTMRNAAAHITSTIQVKLDALALKLLGVPSPGIALYTLLTASMSNGTTVLAHYRDELLAIAVLIATG